MRCNSPGGCHTKHQGRYQVHEWSVCYSTVWLPLHLVTLPSKYDIDTLARCCFNVICYIIADGEPTIKQHRVNLRVCWSVLGTFVAQSVTYIKYNNKNHRCPANENKWIGLQATFVLIGPIGQTGPGEPPEDGEMGEITLPSKHRIRNSNPGGLRPSTLPLGHGGSP